jgi:hypothetical protein
LSATLWRGLPVLFRSGLGYRRINTRRGCGLELCVGPDSHRVELGWDCPLQSPASKVRTERTQLLERCLEDLDAVPLSPTDQRLTQLRGPVSSADAASRLS